jgi:hypothetical protein
MSGKGRKPVPRLGNKRQKELEKCYFHKSFDIKMDRSDIRDLGVRKTKTVGFQTEDIMGNKIGKKKAIQPSLSSSILLSFPGNTRRRRGVPRSNA